MLSSVLNSEQAIQVNIAIMRAFVRMRRMLVSNKEDTGRSFPIFPVASPRETRKKNS